jgi:hypothetical protein
MVTVTGSQSKTITFGVLSPDGKQLFRQYGDLTAIPLSHTLRIQKRSLRNSSYLPIGQPSTGPRQKESTYKGIWKR